LLDRQQKPKTIGRLTGTALGGRAMIEARQVLNLALGCSARPNSAIFALAGGEHARRIHQPRRYDRDRPQSRRCAVTRLTDLPPAQAKRLAELECPDFATRPWVTGTALSQRRVAIVSSAGLVVRGEDPFRGRDADYRIIPSATRPEELLVSHISINFDRTGFQEDWNVVFPLDRLRDLAAEGAIGSVAQTHYSFMGATDPVQMEPHAREVADLLKGDQVDAVILPPV
jgi:D-proline reductase (dithiol) PrdB